MDVALTDQERQALVDLLTHEIEFARSPLSPRVERLGRIRAKLCGERTQELRAARARQKPQPD